MGAAFPGRADLRTQPGMRPYAKGVSHLAGAAAVIIASIVFSQISLLSRSLRSPGFGKSSPWQALLDSLLQCVVADDLKDPQKVAMVFGHPFHPMKKNRRRRALPCAPMAIIRDLPVHSRQAIFGFACSQLSMQRLVCPG